MSISAAEIEKLRIAFLPLLGLKINWFSVPKEALGGFEPSQLAVISNTILDAALPQIEQLSEDPENAEKLKQIQITKAPREFGQREGYPDFVHASGMRVELKGLFVDNAALS